jgi:hypothetical protein
MILKGGRRKAEGKQYKLQTSNSKLRNDLKVTIAAGFHLFPFRTEKLSLPAPMVLQIAGE